MFPSQTALQKNFVAASPAADSASPTGANLYARFAFAGAVCCSITHGAMTPVDVVKTRIQLSPEIYNKGMVGGFRQVIQAEGAGALLTGFGPTAAGYFLQGAFKFGGYEFFKKTFIDLVGVENASANRTLIYLGSSAIAEFFADVALCPLEATRIRLGRIFPLFLDDCHANRTFSNPIAITGLSAHFCQWFVGRLLPYFEGRRCPSWFLLWIRSYLVQASSLHHGQVRCL